MELVREEAARAYTETVEATTGTQVFGTPSSTVLEVLNQEAGSGVPTSIVPLHVAGFTRTGSKTHTWASHFDVSDAQRFTGASRVVASVRTTSVNRGGQAIASRGAHRRGVNR